MEVWNVRSVYKSPFKVWLGCFWFPKSCFLIYKLLLRSPIYFSLLEKVDFRRSTCPFITSSLRLAPWRTPHLAKLIYLFSLSPFLTSSSFLLYLLGVREGLKVHYPSIALACISFRFSRFYSCFCLRWTYFIAWGKILLYLVVVFFS